MASTEVLVVVGRELERAHHQRSHWKINWWKDVGRGRKAGPGKHFS